jgi:hypothetical protein
MNSDDQLLLQIAIEPHLIKIERLFKPGIKLTLIARMPGNDEADVLLTIDDLSEAAKVIERRKHQAANEYLIRELGEEA